MSAEKPARKKRKSPANPLRGKKASVSIHRNGLSIAIEDVAASDAATVGGILLTALRTMVDNGFEELVQDGGAIHGGALGEVPDDDADVETRRPKRIGF